MEWCLVVIPALLILLYQSHKSHKEEEERIAETIQHSREKLEAERKSFEEIKNRFIQDKQLLISKEQRERSITIKEIELARGLYDEKVEMYKQLKANFDKDYIQGRKWLADLSSIIETYPDYLIEYELEHKRNPALVAAKTVRYIKETKEALMRENIFLRSEISAIKEYFPVVNAYEQEILKEELNIRGQSLDTDGIDPVKKLLSDEEYKKLSTSQKNQLALERYLSLLSKPQIGALYEMYLGYTYEAQGYQVCQHGLEKGLEDRGRDLICYKKGFPTLIVQAKCWSQSKLIYEKHIFQLYGSLWEYRKTHPGETVEAVFITSTKLGEFARCAAKELGIKIRENEKLDKGFPMIKCNIGASGEHIYHLPFDQQYNKTRINKSGEFMATTVAEAEARGFRRAYRWFGNST